MEAFSLVVLDPLINAYYYRSITNYSTAYYHTDSYTTIA